MGMGMDGMEISVWGYSMSIALRCYFVFLGFLSFLGFLGFLGSCFSLGNIVFEVLVQFPFQKYITSWVFLALEL